jgi:predicted tellurium resistance membrane protein TerC
MVKNLLTDRPWDTTLQREDVMDWIISLVTLAALEVVLGIDNLIFVSIQADKLPATQRSRARRWGLGIALLTRIMLLAIISWIAGLVKPMFVVLGHGISGRDLVLGTGGLFLLGKAAHEIYDCLEVDHHDGRNTGQGRFWITVLQIGIMDIVFSLDSVITAVGLAQHLWVMIAAVVAAMGVMLLCAGLVGDFVHRHPSVKVLALSFLVLIGATLVMEATGQHVNKTAVYVAMGFSLTVELLNMRMRKRRAAPVELHSRND